MYIFCRFANISVGFVVFNRCLVVFETVSDGFLFVINVIRYLFDDVWWLSEIISDGF